MYFLIIAFGFFLAMRGAKPAPLQRPVEGLKSILRENTDLFLTVSLTLTWVAFADHFEPVRPFIQRYTVLWLGLASYLVSRYQKKGDVFFLSAFTGAFMIHVRQNGLLQELLWAAALGAGIAVFQICFLGLRHRLLLSKVPLAAKGWPHLCLLAGFIAMLLWGFGKQVF